MGNEVSFSSSITAHLDQLAAAYVTGDKGIGQWILSGTSSPTFRSTGLPTDRKFNEADMLKKKFDKTSADLLDRINVLQAALQGVSEVATDISKAADNAALDAAVASMPRRIADVLKLAKPPGSDAKPGSDTELSTHQ